MERIKRRETNVFQEALEKMLIMVGAHWQPHKPEVVKANFSKVLADTPLTEEDIFQYTKELVAEGAMSAVEVCKFITKRMGYEARYLVLGHMQRGGSPCAYDRVLATRMGAYAAMRLLAGGSGEYVCLQNSRIVHVSLKEGLASPRPVDEERLMLAEVMST